jgi:hypothetical protein
MFGLTRPGEKRKAQSNQTWFSYFPALDLDAIGPLHLELNKGRVKDKKW